MVITQQSTWTPVSILPEELDPGKIHRDKLQAEIEHAAEYASQGYSAPTKLAALQDNARYYSSGAGYRDALEAYNLELAKPYAEAWGLTPYQLYSNPNLGTDARARAEYTGIPYKDVDYTPGSADWYKLHPEEAPGYQKPAEQTFTLGSQGATQKVEVKGFPQNQTDYANWLAQGRTFENGKWYEPANYTLAGQQGKSIAQSDQDTLNNLLGTDTLQNQGTLDIPDQTTVPPPVISTPSTPTVDPMEKAQADYLKSVKAPESTADLYEEAYNDPELKAKEQLVNDLTAQLNAIQADAQAAMLTLEQQAGGKDVTSTFLGRQQQEIGRQAAIKGLPVAAQLEAAQGNLKTAQDYIDRLFEYKMKDSEAKWEYNNKIAEIIYNFADANQQRQLDEKRIADDRAYQEKQDMIKRQWDLAGTALSIGDGELFTKITKLDENSPTFKEDLAELAGMIEYIETTTSAQETKFWSEIDSGKNELQQGENWGSVWNRIKAQFPTIPNEVIDNALGGGKDTRTHIQDPNNPYASIPNPDYGKAWGWARGGAFEEFKAKGGSSIDSIWNIIG